MNSPEISQSETEPNVREMMISGEALEKAIWCLEELEPVDLSNKSLGDLDEMVFRHEQLAGQATSREERDRQLKIADAIRRVGSFCRPNNSITAIEEDEEGKFKGLRVEIKELKEE